ncbi:MAG: metallophosphoesterase, partial [Ectothiorhodospiraceae bacterium]|nr:metallophosphoesterase [Ectothiorhodospiraceae bacterium]
MTDVTKHDMPLRVLHVTDTHLFAAESDDLAGVRTEQTCLDVLSHVRAEAGRLDLVLHTGDLVHDYSDVAYGRLRERLLDFGVPTLVIPGNHDHAGQMRKQFAEPPVTWQFHTVAGGWLSGMLDTSIYGKPGGRLQESELRQLDEVLHAHPELPALICLHHHPVPMGSAWIDRIGVENGE